MPKTIMMRSLFKFVVIFILLEGCNGLLTRDLSWSDGGVHVALQDRRTTRPMPSHDCRFNATDLCPWYGSSDHSAWRLLLCCPRDAHQWQNAIDYVAMPQFPVLLAENPGPERKTVRLMSGLLAPCTYQATNALVSFKYWLSASSSLKLCVVRFMDGQKTACIELKNHTANSRRAQRINHDFLIPSTNNVRHAKYQALMLEASIENDGFVMLDDLKYNTTDGCLNQELAHEGSEPLIFLWSQMDQAIKTELVYMLILNINSFREYIIHTREAILPLVVHAEPCEILPCEFNDDNNFCGYSIGSGSNAWRSKMTTSSHPDAPYPGKEQRKVELLADFSSDQLDFYVLRSPVYSIHSVSGQQHRLRIGVGGDVLNKTTFMCFYGRNHADDRDPQSSCEYAESEAYQSRSYDEPNCPDCHILWADVPRWSAQFDLVVYRKPYQGVGAVRVLWIALMGECNVL